MKDQCYSQQSRSAAESRTESARVKMTTLLSERRRITRGIRPGLPFEPSPLSCLYSAALFKRAVTLHSWKYRKAVVWKMELGIVRGKYCYKKKKIEWIGALKRYGSDALRRIKGRAFTGNSEKASIESFRFPFRVLFDYKSSNVWSDYPSIVFWTPSLTSGSAASPQSRTSRLSVHVDTQHRWRNGGLQHGLRKSTLQE